MNTLQETNDKNMTSYVIFIITTLMLLINTAVTITSKISRDTLIGIKILSENYRLA